MLGCTSQHGEGSKMKRYLVMMSVMTLILFGLNLSSAEARQDVYVGGYGEALGEVYIDADTAKMNKHVVGNSSDKIKDYYGLTANFYSEREGWFTLNFMLGITRADNRALVLLFYNDDEEPIESFYADDVRYVKAIRSFLITWDYAVSMGKYPFKTITREQRERIVY